GYHKRLFENALKYHSGEPVSGILLLYSSCALHVIESCIGTIHFIIQDLASLQNQEQNALFQEIKVLVVSHNIPSRLFPDWYVTTVTPSVTYLQDTTQAQSTEEVLTECLVLLFKLAAYVPKTFEDDSDDLNNDLHTLAPELIIPAETVNYLCDTEEFPSPEEFLKMYLNPLQPAMDSGMLLTVLGT
ncbi:TEX47 protein, partial [Nothoprocta ornata]|nr:TEX47 protein [Nothoprocta pentlandii]NWY02911.1 TEX47 protein [Nothoprocta ornata]